jgi:hypothetical protein
MKLLRLTLVSDGPTDRALLPIVRWLLEQHSTALFEQNWADLRRLPRREAKLAGRVQAALDMYPCDVLVVHRDAEREPPQSRLAEINAATRACQEKVVCAVPVRMTEAWLLFDEPAIRRAAGCPNGTNRLNLPSTLKEVESIPDPKTVVHQALRVASNLSGRRLKQLQPDIRRLSDLIDDFAPLRALPSFCCFEQSLRKALRSLNVLRPSE